MVIRRTIENLRERPKDERQNIAFLVALGVGIVLFLGWFVFFLRNTAVTVGNVPEAYNAAVGNVQEAVDQTGWVSEAKANDRQDYVPVEAFQPGASDASAVQIIEQSGTTSQ